MADINKKYFCISEKPVLKRPVSKILKNILLLLVGITVINFDLSAQEDGTLDLPDIYIWGEDRSIMPEIGIRDMYLFPYLNKASFMEDLKLKDPEKARPGDEDYKELVRTKFYGGAGTQSEYSVRIIHENNVRGDWFYNFNLMGNRKHFEEQEDYDDFRAGVHMGKNYSFGKFTVGAKGLVGETDFKRNLGRMNGEFELESEKLELNSGFVLDGADIDDDASGEYKLYVKSGFPVADNCWLRGDYDINIFDVEDDDENWHELRITYLNDIFRDFSFSTYAGYRSDYGDNFTYGIRFSGELFTVGYSVFYSMENNSIRLYDLAKAYPYIKVTDLYEPEERKIGGLALSRKLASDITGDLSLSYSEIEKFSAIFYMPNSVFFDNLEEDVDDFEISVGVQNNFASLRGVTGTGDDLPNAFNEVVLEFFPEFYFNQKKRMTIYSSLSYIDEYEIWSDVMGAVKTTIDGFVSWNAEAAVEINKDVILKAGVENILAQETLFPGGFFEEKPRIYAMVLLGHTWKKR
jgi:hypothetical protein